MSSKKLFSQKQKKQTYIAYIGYGRPLSTIWLATALLWQFQLSLKYKIFANQNEVFLSVASIFGHQEFQAHKEMCHLQIWALKWHCLLCLLTLHQKSWRNKYLNLMQLVQTL